MKLYNLTIRKSDIVCGAACNLQLDELVPCLIVSRGTWFEVLRITSENRLELVWRRNLFQNIRHLSIAKSNDSQLLVLCFDRELAFMEWDGTQFISKSKRSFDNSIFRTIPEYVTTDDKGMVACVGIESTRKVMIPPYESFVDASIPNMFTYDICASNRELDNSAFACLERLRLQNSKQLTVYEFNRGLNHVLKLWSVQVPDDANIVLDFGPECSLVVTDHTALVVKNGEISETASIGESLIISATKMSNMWAILQIDDGTLMSVKATNSSIDLKVSKVTLIDEDEDDDSVKDLSIYSKMVTFKSGFLFGISEYGPHQLSQITELEPLSLTLASSIGCLSPITSSALVKSQLRIASRRCATSKCISLLLGKGTETLASTPLPFQPTRVFTAKRNSGDKYDGLIILSTPSATTILAVDEEGGVNEVDQALTGISGTVGTLAFATMKTGSIQVHSEGLRFIKNASKIQEWSAGGAQVLAVAHTSTQIVLSLSNRQVVYFELSSEGNSLLESQHRSTLPDASPAVCFSASDDLKSLGLYVALRDDTIRMYEVPNFKQKKLIALPYMCTSIVDIDPNDSILYVGHINGALTEYKNGELYTRALGSSPVKLFAVSKTSLVAISTHSWFISEGNVHLMSGAGKPEMVQPFSTEDLSGMVAIESSSSEILEVTANETGQIESSNELGEVDSTVITFLCDGKFAVSKNGVYLIGGDQVFTTNSPIIAATVVTFSDDHTEYIVLGTETNLVLLEFKSMGFHEMHTTPVSPKCTTLKACKGRLLAFSKNSIIAYGLGKKHLSKQFGIELSGTHVIRAVECSSEYIFVGDSRRSVTVFRLDESTSTFQQVCDDPVWRSITTMALSDQCTVCTGDQFGNISVLRVPDQAGQKHSELVAFANVQDAIVSIHKGSLTPLSGGFEALIYLGVSGTIGLMIPLISTTEIESLSQLETLVRQARNISHMTSQNPSKNVISGNVCSTFGALDSDSQIEIAESLEMTPQKVRSQSATVRHRVAL